MRQAIIRLPGGYTLTERKALVLRELAGCGAGGTCAVHGVMDGGQLAALVQFGLAERMPSDAIGGMRYRIAPSGREMLAQLGWDQP
jgi:hypothetical protein